MMRTSGERLGCALPLVIAKNRYERSVSISRWVIFDRFPRRLMSGLPQKRRLWT